jgi:prepilin-type N-terminal cleavage/methylation domain-containing protein
MRKKDTKGFTLIELLVVIAIVGILASVVIASVNTSRKKSKDAFILRTLQEMRTLLALEFDSSTNYQSLNFSAWVPISTDCDSKFVGVSLSNQEKLIKMCNDIVNASEASSSGEYRFTIYAEWPHTTYSIMAFFPYKRQFICMGSSYKFSYIDSISAPLWPNEPGCYNNP